MKVVSTVDILFLERDLAFQIESLQTQQINVQLSLYSLSLLDIHIFFSSMFVPVSVFTLSPVTNAWLVAEFLLVLVTC